MSTLKQRWAATLAAGVIAVSGAAAPVVFAPVAGAQVQNPTGINQENGSLTIHKFANNTPGAAGNGTELTDVSGLGSPLGGAVFKVTPVTGVNLKTNAGWQKAANIQKGNEEPTLGTPQTKTTGTDGLATFSDLPVGLYKVEETSAPAGYEAKTAAPFFVTIPMTNPTNNNSWMYDIHVYPKNGKQENVITKTVNDADTVTVGNQIKYTVAGKLPSAQRLTSALLGDLYPTERLETPAVESVTYGNGDTADAGDYRLDTNTAGQAKIVFTEQGLTKLNGLRGAERKVTAVLTFNVKESDSNAPIANGAWVDAKGEGDNTPPIDPTNPGPDNPNVIPPNPTNPNAPKTYFGNVKINKVGDNAEKLNGVKFDLYRCNSASELVGDAVKTDITTAGEGTVTINSLHVNDYVNGAQGDTTPSGYCLVEKQSASGYALLAEPHYFQVLKGNDANVPLTTQDITNVKNNGGFELPLTGGNGVYALLALGGLVMAGGAVYMVRTNRRENKA